MSRKLILLLSAVFAVLPVIGAEQRLATVDMARVFREYYRTAQVEAELKKQAGVFRNYVLEQEAAVRKLEDQFKKQRDIFQSIAFDEKQKSAARQEAEKIAARIQSTNAEKEAYVTEKNRSMAALGQQRRNEILADITREVTRQAQAGGYSFVFDTAGLSANNVPVVVYSTPAVDLTDAVIKTLNLGRPAGH